MLAGMITATPCHVEPILGHLDRRASYRRGNGARRRRSRCEHLLSHRGLAKTVIWYAERGRLERRESVWKFRQCRWLSSRLPTLTHHRAVRTDRSRHCVGSTHLPRGRKEESHATGCRQPRRRRGFSPQAEEAITDPPRTYASVRTLAALRRHKPINAKITVQAYGSRMCRRRVASIHKGRRRSA